MKFPKYIICLMLICIFNFSTLYADEIATKNDEKIKNEYTDEQIQKQKEELKNEVSNLTEQIRNKIVEIDDRITELKSTDEYSTYPTIRLNIDTPIFGLKSIINQKLRITKDVSASDVAKGYSLRYVVKNRVVKVPTTKLGNIVVSTNEIDIDDDLDVNEYNTLILKLMNYKDKANSIYNFLDDKTNKLYKEFISKEKKDKLNEFSNRLSEINKTLLDEDGNLNTIYLIGYKDYTKLNEKYLSLKESKKKLDKKISNVFIEKSKLNDIQKSIISLESDVIDYTTEIEKVLTENEDISIEKLYLNTYNDLNSRYKKIEKYIDDSENEIEIDNTENTEETESDNKVTSNTNTNKKGNEKIVTTQSVKVYDIFSKKYSDTMKTQITSLEEKMDELEIIYKSENNETKEAKSTKKESTIDENNKDNKDNKNDSKSEEKYKTLTDEEIENNIEEVIEIYNVFLNNQYLFYLDNLNGLLNLTNAKLKNLAEYTSADVIAHIQYIYIDLPTVLENYLDTYDVNSSIEMKVLISSFESERNKLLKEYLDIVELYEDMNVDEIINKT